MSEPENKISDVFRRMADAIDKNSGLPFGGAVVIVSPAQSGEANQILDFLLLDSSQNVGQFWGLIKGKADIALRQVDSAERQGQAFGRNR